MLLAAMPVNDNNIDILHDISFVVVDPGGGSFQEAIMMTIAITITFATMDPLILHRYKKNGKFAVKAIPRGGHKMMTMIWAFCHRLVLTLRIYPGPNSNDKAKCNE